MKLPLMSSSPGRLWMGLLSPVSRLSLTWHSPSSTTASAGIWSPRPRRIASSSTIWSRSSSTSDPSRTATAFFEASSVSLSTMCLERRAWMIPIAVLRNTMPKNVRFFHAPVMMTSTARTTLMRLNRVHTFSMTSSRTDLVLSSVLTFTLPAEMRSSTSANERPRSSKGLSAFVLSMRLPSQRPTATGRRHRKRKVTSDERPRPQNPNPYAGSRSIRMVRHIGFEPTTFCSGGRRSDPLS